MRCALILLFTFIHLNLMAKVLLITHSYNRPEFIEIQAKTYRAFLQDEYEQVIFNDASNENMQLQIEKTCEKLGIRCFRIPQELHKSPYDPGSRHIDGIQYSLEQIGYNYDGMVTLVDSDLFLIKPFSIERFMIDCDISGELQGRENENTKIRHFSPILVFMNMKTLPNKQTLTFEGGIIEGLACDVGAQTYYYLKNNPSIKTRYFTLAYLPALRRAINCYSCNNLSCNYCNNQLLNYQFDEAAINFIRSCPDDNMEFVLNNNFLHYRCGSNWNNKSVEYHAAKNKALNDYINNILYTHYYHLHAFKAAF